MGFNFGMWELVKSSVSLSYIFLLYKVVNSDYV